jgi:hypothetical protein
VAAADGFDDDAARDEYGSDLPQRIGPSIYERARSLGSLTNWVALQDFKQARNKHECEVLAQALDQLLVEGLSFHHSDAMEILARRLAAVHLADQHTNWNLAKAIQLPTHQSSLLPLSQLNQAMRTASTIARVETSLRSRRTSYRGGGRGGYRGGGGGGGGGYRGYNRGPGGGGGRGGGYGRGAQRPQQDGGAAPAGRGGAGRN